MKKLSRKSSIALLLTIVIAAIAALVIVHVYHSRTCRDVIGDGYPMGTDPVPVVVANTCDE